MSRKQRVIDARPIEDSVILEFLNSKDVKTRKTYTSNFRKILEFSKDESGQSMLDNVVQWSRKIMAFRQFMIEQGYSLNTIEGTTGALRGFFAYWKKPLDLSKADKKKLGRKARNSEDYAFTQQDLKKLNDIAALNEKYVLLCGVSFGLRAEDFVKLTFGKYRVALDNAQKENLEAPVPLGKMNTCKEDVEAYPFISSDALPIVKAELDAHKDSKDDDLVFDRNPVQLTAILQSLVFKAGIDVHGQRVRFHCLRKFLYDRIVSASNQLRADQILGHKLAGQIAPYIGEGSLREVYIKAQSSILLNSNGNGKVVKLEEENKKLTEELKEAQAKILELENGQKTVTSKTATNETLVQELMATVKAQNKRLEDLEKKGSQ